MVNEELIVQAGERPRSRSRVAGPAALDEIKQQNSLDDAGLAALLNAQGFNDAELQDDLPPQIMRLRAINQLVAPKIQVSDDEVRAATTSCSAARSGQLGPPRPHPGQVARSPDPSRRSRGEDQGDRRDRADPRREDFAAVCAQVSDDASTAQSGGELGWFERGSISDPAGRRSCSR